MVVLRTPTVSNVAPEARLPDADGLLAPRKEAASRSWPLRLVDRLLTFDRNASMSAPIGDGAGSALCSSSGGLGKIPGIETLFEERCANGSSPGSLEGPAPPITAALV